MHEPGSKIGRYRLADPLGRGAMGQVFRAVDEQLGRAVALKFLSETGHTDPELRARMEIEARALASLQHPNVATLYGFEVHENEPYLAMELVDGETLEGLLERRALEPQEGGGLLRTGCQRTGRGARKGSASPRPEAAASLHCASCRVALVLVQHGRSALGRSASKRPALKRQMLSPVRSAKGRDWSCSMSWTR